MKKSYFALLFALPLLTGCGSEMIKKFAKEVRQLEEGTGGQKPAPQPAIYCYNTLGEASCYDKPQPKDSDGSYVGTTAEPVDPAITENQIEGNTALPAVPVEEIKIPHVESVPADSPSSAPNNTPTENAPDTKPAKNAEKPVDANAALPAVQPEKPAAQGAVEPQPEISVDAPANRPLYDPYLNQMEQAPADNTAIVPPVQQPIVPPKTKSKKTKKQ